MLLSPAVWSVACDSVFTNGVQSHAHNGTVHLGYMSRVNGGSTILDTPNLTMTSTWQDQAGLCNGVICAASGNPTAISAPTVLSGSYIPENFLTGTGSNGVINVPQGVLQERPAGDYGSVTVQSNNGRLRFTSANTTYRMGGVSTQYRSVLELQPGDYWINGNLELGQEMTLRRLNGGGGPVRLYVNGNVTTEKIFIEGFASGQLMIYATGNISFGNETNIPGFVYARGNVTFTQNAVVSNGVYAPSFSTGNRMDLTYSEVDTNHFFGTFTADHQAVIKMQPGDYWFSGNLTFNEVTLERLNGASGPVRIFVSGNIDIRHAAKFNNFGPGQLLIYAAQNININSQQHVPAFIYAAGDIDIGFRSGVTGAISGRQVSVGQESVVTYVTPRNLGALCTDGVDIAYYALSHASAGVTCEAEPVLITAFGTDNNPVVPSAGTTAVLATDPLAGNWIGGAAYVFGGTESSFIKYLQQTTPAVLALLVTDGIASGSSAIAFADAGLRFDGLPIVPDSLVAGSTYPDARIRVIQTNTDTGACEVRVTGSMAVGLGYECLNPLICSGGQHFTVNGSGIPANNNGAASNFSSVTLNFDATGTASIPLSFSDVGHVRLHGQLDLPPQGNHPAITLSGSSADFVVRPHHFQVMRVYNASEENTDGTTGFAAAGENFGVIVQARNEGGGVTSNFGNEISPEGVTLRLGDLVSPAGGVPGALANQASFIRAGTSGEFTNEMVSWSEVGTINLNAHIADGSYLGTGDVVDAPDFVVGRFYPHHFSLTDSTVEDSCSDFTYLGHPAMTLSYKLEARSLQENVTTNYNSPAYAQTASINYVAEDANNGEDLGSRLTLENSTWSAGIFSVDTAGATFERKPHQTLPLPARAVDGPFNSLQFGLYLTGGDERLLKGKNMNPETSDDCTLNDTCTAIRLGSPRVARFGRVRLDDAFGPESVNLPVRFATEFWNGSFFAPATADGCTQIPRSAIAYPAGSIVVDANRTVALNGGSTQGHYADLQTDHIGFIEGNAGHFFSAPGTGTGSFTVDINLQALPWLRYDWNQNGDFDDDAALPAANIGFGQYRGHDRIIYWREVLE